MEIASGFRDPSVVSIPSTKSFLYILFFYKLVYNSDEGHIKNANVIGVM